jgi:hypothetical protein
MYYRLTGEIERKVIHDLVQYWSYHPKYKDDLPSNIKGKYRFDERPHCGMTVRVSGGDPVTMSPDNYMGEMNSYILLAKVPPMNGAVKNGTFLEWIREDTYAINANQGRFPSPPGVYYIEVTAHDPQTGLGEIMVDPLYDVRNYRPTVTRNLGVDQFTIPRIPVPNSFRIYELPSNRLLVEGEDYMFSGPQTITMVDPLPATVRLSVDYRYAGTSTGPFQFRESNTVTQAIPGVVLAFGRSVEKGDVLSVVVYDRRQRAYRVYGGKWDIQVEIEVITDDKQTQMEITDRTAMHIQSILKGHWSNEGIELISCSLGSQSEEVRDQAGDEYFYMATISISVQTDWEVHDPLIYTIRAYESSGVIPYSNPYITGHDPAEGIMLNPYIDPFFYTSMKPTFATLA